TFGGPLFGTAALTTNTWTHFAGTYDGMTLRLYVNGTQVASRAQTGPIAISTNALQIGGDSIYGQYFPGKIDEIRIYNRALSATEIQSDMNTAISP
ncbi:MAG TPA: LamG domain-containing protein, partial [Terriglobales bacterium]|nr:LamG domain-containing protein [Terriglobales bacterium]